MILLGKWFPATWHFSVRVKHQFTENGFIMDNTTTDNSNANGASSQKRDWNILNWNIRGLNSDDKQRAVRSKITESACSIYCLQETKMNNIDHSTVRKWAPKRFNQFAYHASEG